MMKNSSKYRRPRVRILDAHAEHAMLQSSGTAINHGTPTSASSAVSPINIQAYGNGGSETLTFNY